MARSEAQTRFDLINPVIQGKCGWMHPDYSAIVVEEREAAVEIIDGKGHRRATKPKDYVLYWDCSGGNEPQPLAIIEAKHEGKHAGHGLQQGLNYRVGKLRHIPTVIATNGHEFVRFSERTGLTSDEIPIAEFPRPEDLCAEQAAYLGFHPSDPDAKPWVTQPDLGALQLRYYQQAGIRAAVQKLVVARRSGIPARAMLALATGSGKTKLAAALLKQLDAAGQLTRALFVCDRDPLRASAIGEMQQVFHSNAAVVDAGNPQPNAKILVATYQTLGFTPDTAESDLPESDKKAYPPTPASADFSAPPTPPAGSFFVRNYPENYFDVIVIDECHRSAWGEWKVILDRNPRALHVGLTATPRTIKLPKNPDGSTPARVAEDERLIADNRTYFGESVYSYDYLDGVADGYLAPCLIKTFDIFHDERADPERLRGVLRADLDGKEIANALTGSKLGPDAVAEQNAPSSIDSRLVLPERAKTFAAHFFAQLLAAGEGDPHQKTIVFCQSDAHARRVVTELNNEYARWCTEHGKKKRARSFAFQCTASTNGKDLVPDFRGLQHSHFIATTVDLLSTGVDVPCVRHIVFFRYIQSPILFHQMVGRGTRIDEKTDKLMFTLWDYTGATALFGRDFESPPPGGGGGEDGPGGPTPPPPPPPVRIRGTRFKIEDSGDFQLHQADGRPQRVTLEEYQALLVQKLAALSPNLADFRARWIDFETRADLLDALEAEGLGVRRLPEASRHAEFDTFDLLAALVYDIEPLTRAQRAERFLKAGPSWLVQLPQPTAEVVHLIVRQFEAGGTEALETEELFRQIAVPGHYALALLKQAGEPKTVIRQIKEGLFAA